MVCAMSTEHNKLNPDISIGEVLAWKNTIFRIYVMHFDVHYTWECQLV